MGVVKMGSRWLSVVFVLVAIELVMTQGASPPSLTKRLQHARSILKEVPLVDGHNDVAIGVRKLLKNQLNDFHFNKNFSQTEPWASYQISHTDLPRIRAGQLGAQFWSAFVPCPAQHKNAVALVLEQMDVIRRIVRKYPDDLQMVTTAKGLLEAHARGKVASLIGVEGGHCIDSSLAILRTLYNEGARYMTLTHTCSTPWASSSNAEDDGQAAIGLTAWGQLVVKEMNRLGMLVDISHVSSQTMRDVMAVTRAPVIFSHSNARSICNASRNVPDDVLLQLKTNGGVAMVVFFPPFVSCSDNATLQDVVAHINYIRDVAGVDHVGIGGDYDGMNLTPEGLEDVSKYPDLFAELLLDPRWTDEDLKKLAGLNLIRTLKEAERIRDELLKEDPYDDPIPQEDLTGLQECDFYFN